MTKGRKIRILIADDHYIVRMGLVAMVNSEPDMEVVAEAADGEQAIELYAKSRPDLALLDTRMPVKDGVQATVEIRKRFPGASILMLTAFDGDAEVRRALGAGVKGYVLKSSTGDDLIPALRAVFAGEQWVPKELASRLAALKSFEELTPREVDVLRHLGKGLANKQIAEALHITEYTVKDHLKNILAKLRVADRTEAVTVALRRGIIHLEP
jgi:DNA-binding NarL/FixJ family response regulator